MRDDVDLGRTDSVHQIARRRPRLGGSWGRRNRWGQKGGHCVTPRRGGSAVGRRSRCALVPYNRVEDVQSGSIISCRGRISIPALGWLYDCGRRHPRPSHDFLGYFALRVEGGVAAGPLLQTLGISHFSQPSGTTMRNARRPMSPAPARRPLDSCNRLDHQWSISPCGLCAPARSTHPIGSVYSRVLAFSGVIPPYLLATFNYCGHKIAITTI